MAFEIPANGPVRVRESIVASEAPLTTELEEGELALNSNDGVLYFQTSANTIGQFPSATGIKKIVKLTQAQYDALTPDTSTLYIIT